MAKGKSKKKKEEVKETTAFMPDPSLNFLINLNNMLKKGAKTGLPVVDEVRAINLLYKEKRLEKQRKLSGSNVPGVTFVSDLDYPTPPWDEDMLLDLVRFNTWHYKCIEVKAEDAVRPGFKFLFSKREEPSKADEKNKFLLENFFANVNDKHQSIDDIATRMLKDFWRTNSRMCCEVFRNKLGIMTGIGHVDASRIRPHKKAFVRKGTPGYQPVFRYEVAVNSPIWFKQFGVEESYDALTGKLADEKTTLFANDLIYITSYEPGTGENASPYAPYYGLPILIPGIIASIGFWNIGLFNISFFKSSIKNAIMVSGKLNKNVEKYIKEFMESEGQGVDMKTLLLLSDDPEAKIQIQQIFDKALDASFLKYYEQTRDESISLHGVPRNRLGIMETGTLGGHLGSTANEIYKDTVLAPAQRITANWINAFIIADPRGLNIQDWIINFNRLDTADHKYLLDLATKMFDRGNITRNQALNLVGLDPDFEDEEGKERAMLSTYLPESVWSAQTPESRLPSNVEGDIRDPNMQQFLQDKVPSLNKGEDKDANDST